MIRGTFGALLLAAVLCPALAGGETFRVGAAAKDVTPTASVPMWGYGVQDRPEFMSTGVNDPLFAKAIVIDVGTSRLALVGLDIGRSPTKASMDVIRKGIKKKAGVDYVMISGSHTHHGPVLELTDLPDRGKGKYDDAVAYVRTLEQALIDVIAEAAGKSVDARMGVATQPADYNTNRLEDSGVPRDPDLTVMRFDDLTGKPIAVLVSFAAHPTTMDPKDTRFSAEYCGALQRTVEAELGGVCAFMQGAAGDLRTHRHGMETMAFGEHLGKEVVKLAGSIKTATPSKPSILAMDEDMTFTTRRDIKSAEVMAGYAEWFFPELVANFANESPDGKIHPHLTTVLLNETIGLVGASGEFFSNHAVRLKERAGLEHTLFFGYCNGYHLYFPTIEQAAKGGYGADALVNWAEIGAGEAIMNRALINLYTMRHAFDDTGIRQPAD